MLRLSPRGAGILREFVAGVPVADVAAGGLARRLVDAGLAHPRPPADVVTPDIEVVVPARDRADELTHCLQALAGMPGVVVDDGSANPLAVARAVAGHGDLRLLRRDANGGPGAARNTGVAASTAPLLAFVDSDCRVTPDVLRGLARHFADPCVGAVALRITPRPATTAPRMLRVLAATRSPLDLGATPGDVGAGRVLRFVPSTVLVVRRTAFDAVTGFDETLRYGEDVDLGWRLVDAGWSVRYDPSLAAEHAEPVTWRGWLRRHYCYGTSAGPLDRRYPGRLAGPSLRGLAAPVLAAAGRHDTHLPRAPVLRAATLTTVQTVVGLARWGMPLWWPLACTARSRQARLLITAAAVAPAFAEWLRCRPDVDAIRYVGAALADDAAYGAGVWAGCLRARTWRPLLPRISVPR
jgi:mycofactocin system glycosyltransferase